MVKKTSIAITIFAVLEIIVGGIGSILLVKNFMAYLGTIYTSNGSTGISGALALVGIVLYLPSPMFLSAGISIFIGIAVGKIVNNMALSFLYFLFMMIIGFHIYTAHYKSIILDFLIFSLSTLPIQWFLNHRLVKDLETKQY